MAEKRNKEMVQPQYRPIADIEMLHNNPRFIKDADFKTLCDSLKANPEFFEARPLILSDRTGILTVIAGNMRLRAAIEIGLKEVPTVLIPKLTKEKEEEIIIRDNVSNGSWDMDALANEWSHLPLEEWGAPVWETPEEDEEVDDKPEKQSVVKLTIEFSDLLQFDEAKAEIEELLNGRFPAATIKY